MEFLSNLVHWLASPVGVLVLVTVLPPLFVWSAKRWCVDPAVNTTLETYLGQKVAFQRVEDYVWGPRLACHGTGLAIATIFSVETSFVNRFPFSAEDQGARALLGIGAIVLLLALWVQAAKLTARFPRIGVAAAIERSVSFGSLHYSYDPRVPHKWAINSLGVAAYAGAVYLLLGGSIL